MTHFALKISEIQPTDLLLVGGKALNLSKLTKIPGISVPAGFCVTTKAFQVATENNQQLKELLQKLSQLRRSQQKQIADLSLQIREEVLKLKIPQPIVEAIENQLRPLGPNQAYAVRSSATAEDLPQASFAGQYDSFLNIKGKEAVLEHILKCWASLYSERAVLYRLTNGLDQNVQLAVIVQKMVLPETSGVLFTADPVSGHRKITSINASFGLGEALVAGQVSPDSYQVLNDQIIKKTIGAKKLISSPKEGQGTTTRKSATAEQTAQALSDKEVLELAMVGKKIESYFGYPQDIEWCFSEGTFQVVQSRPITTLYPIPHASDEKTRAYVSVGHQQMMTDAMKPLGLSFFLLTTPAPMVTAGGRLFVDITGQLTTHEGRQSLLNTLGVSDPLLKDGLTTLFEREAFAIAEEQNAGQTKATDNPPVPKPNLEVDPSLVPSLIEKHQTAITNLQDAIAKKSGLELFEFIPEDFQRLRENIGQGMPVIIAAMQASAWLNTKMDEWLGEKNAADTLSQGVPYNITSQMGLDLLDVADVIRPYPEIVSYLEQTDDDDFLEKLLQFAGGDQVRQAIVNFLEKYGMRCPGEIDVTRPRWAESPRSLLPLILSNVKNFQPGAGKKLLEEKRQAALTKAQELLARLEKLPDGQLKAKETQARIEVLRNYSGYREYPKYVMVTWYFTYKQALLKEAEKLVESALIQELDDVYYLTFDELAEAVATAKLDYQLIEKRKRDFEFFQKLTPPRLMTSDGEIIRGKYSHENLPPSAIPGLPVSSGVIEGRARVVLSLEDAELEEGDILVTTFTDPSWTPLFLSCQGLVTEVGGLMTHGAVIAREYGLPAVVGVVDATKLIKDGQKIRVNGTAGYIEIL